jgi:hemolysin activation/secretion protein
MGARLYLRSAALIGLIGWPAYAQVAPAPPGSVNSETLRRQQQLENALPTPQTQPQTAPVTGSGYTPGAASVGDNNVRFVLKTLSFDNSAFLSADELKQLGQPYIGQTVSFADLNQLTEKINALYASKGDVTAHAILPPQNIENGAVHISLVEGRVGEVVLRGAEHTDEEYVRASVPLLRGALMDVTGLSQNVVYFNRTNSTQLRAALKAGQTFGQTDVELDVVEPPSDTLQIFVDNYGPESTGQAEGGIFYRHSNLLGRDDQFTAYGTGSSGGIDGSVTYDVPFDEEGDRVSANYEHNLINVVSGPASALNITGHGQSGTIGVTHPLVADQNWLVVASLRGSIGTSSTTAAAAPLTDTTTYRAIGGLSATFIGYGAVVSLMPNLSYANSHNSILAQVRDIGLFTGTGSAVADLGDQFSLRAAGSWQLSSGKLLPADLLFQIGGPNSVRGYPSGSFAGDTGFFGNLELHRKVTGVAQGMDVFVFGDTGTVYSTSPAERSITSVGAGTSVNFLTGTALSASVGFPLDRALPTQDDYQIYVQFATTL